MLVLANVMAVTRIAQPLTTASVAFDALIETLALVGDDGRFVSAPAGTEPAPLSDDPVAPNPFW